MSEDRELAEVLSDIAQVTRVVLVELREGNVVPRPAQWARAQALREAREWVEYRGIRDDEIEDPLDATATDVIDALAERWSTWIYSGVMPERGE